MAGPSHTLAALADHAGARCVGDPATNIVGVGSLAHAEPGHITHLSSPRYRDQLAHTSASAVILAEAELAHWTGNALVTPNPYLAFARVSQLFAQPPWLPAGRHPQAIVDPTAKVAASARLGPGVVVGAEANIGANARLHANVVVGERCQIGADCTLMPNVVLYADVRLGPRCVVHSAAVLGADGFGFAVGEDEMVKVIPSPARKEDPKNWVLEPLPVKKPRVVREAAE